MEKVSTGQSDILMKSYLASNDAELKKESLERMRMA
jgi:hypothetical protein